MSLVRFAPLCAYAAVSLAIFRPSSSLAQQKLSGAGSGAWTAKLTEISVVRTKSDVLGEQDRKKNYTQVYLQLCPPGNSKITAYSVRILQIDPVKDNTGKELTPNERRKSIDLLNRDIVIPVTSSFLMFPDRKAEFRTGPELRVKFDVPARNARFIRSLHLKLRVLAVELQTLDEGKLLELDGRQIHDARLGGLSVKPTVNNTQNRVTVDLKGDLRRFKDFSIEFDDVRPMTVFDTSTLFSESGTIFEKATGTTEIKTGRVAREFAVKRFPSGTKFILNLWEPVGNPNEVELDLKDIAIPEGMK